MFFSRILVLLKITFVMRKVTPEELVDLAQKDVTILNSGWEEFGLEVDLDCRPQNDDGKEGAVVCELSQEIRDSVLGFLSKPQQLRHGFDIPKLVHAFGVLVLNNMYGVKYSEFSSFLPYYERTDVCPWHVHVNIGAEIRHKILAFMGDTDCSGPTTDIVRFVPLIKQLIEFANVTTDDLKLAGFDNLGPEDFDLRSMRFDSLRESFGQLDFLDYEQIVLLGYWLDGFFCTDFNGKSSLFTRAAMFHALQSLKRNEIARIEHKPYRLTFSSELVTAHGRIGLTSDKLAHPTLNGKLWVDLL